MLSTASSSTPTAHDMRVRLDRLVAERRQAETTGIRNNDFHMEALEREITAANNAFIGFAVTEIAILRSRLSGPQRG